MHSPFTLRQRKMWTFYLLFMTAACALSPLCLAMALGVMPLKQSAAITIVLLLIWAGVALSIIRRMSAPGGRLSKEGLD